MINQLYKLLKAEEYRPYSQLAFYQNHSYIIEEVLPNAVTLEHVTLTPPYHLSSFDPTTQK